MPARETVARRQSPDTSAYREIEHGKYERDPKGFTKFPHAYEFLITPDDKGRRKLSDGHVQRDLVYLIARKTWGDEKRPEWAKLAIRALAKMCGCEPSSIVNALADLIDRKIIEVRDRTGCTANTGKMYRLCPENWRKAKPYGRPVDASLLALAERVQQGWIDDAAEQGEDDATEAVERIEDAEATVQPRKPSRPRCVPFKPRGATESVPVEIVYHSDFEQPIRLRAQARTGQLHVTASPAPASADEGKAKSCTSPQVHDFAPSVANKELYRDGVPAILLELWNTTKPAAWVNKLIERAGGAPYETWLDQVRLKFPRRESAREHQPAMLLLLADDAATTHRTREAKKTRPAALAKTPAPAIPPDDEDDMERRFQEEMARPIGSADPNACPFCHGSKFVGTGSDRSQCGICQGSGRKRGAA